MSVLKQRPWLRVSICLATIMVMVVPAHAIETAGELFVDLNANSFGDNTDLWTNPGTYTDFELAAGLPLFILDQINGCHYHDRATLCEVVLLKLRQSVDIRTEKTFFHVKICI